MKTLTTLLVTLLAATATAAQAQAVRSERNI